MKKFLVLIALVGLTGFLPRSPEARSKFEIGAKGALNISSPEFNGFDNTDSRSLPGGGFFFRFNSGNFTSFELDVLYVRKGAVARFRDGIYTWPGLEYRDVTVTYTYRLDYLEIPLTARVCPVRFGKFSPYLFAGQALGIRIKAERDYSAVALEGPELYSESDTEDLKTRTSNLDFGLVFGGGVDIAMGRGALLLEGRFTFGVHNVEEDYEWYLWADSNTKLKSRVFSIVIGYSFPLGGSGE